MTPFGRARTRKGCIITISVIIMLTAALAVGGWFGFRSWLSSRLLDNLERHERHRRLTLARVELDALRTLGRRARSGALAENAGGLSFLLSEELLNRCLRQFVGLEGVSGNGDDFCITGADLQCLDGLAIATFDLEVDTRYPGISARGRADTLLTLGPGEAGDLVGRFRIISVSPDYTIQGRRIPAFEFLKRMTSARLDRSARLKIPDLHIPLALAGDIPFGKVDRQAAGGSVTVEMPAGSLGYRVEIGDAGFYRGFIRAAASAVTVTASGKEGKKDGRAAGPGWVAQVTKAGGEGDEQTLHPLAGDPAGFERELARLENQLETARAQLAQLDLPRGPGSDAEVRCSRELLDGLLHQLAGALEEDVQITIENMANAWQKEQKLFGRPFRNHADIIHADGRVDIRDLRLLGMEGNRLEVGVEIEGDASGTVKVSMYGLTSTVPVDLQVRADRVLIFTMRDDGEGGFVVQPEPAEIPLDVTAQVHVASYVINLSPPLSLEADKVIRPARVPLGLESTITIPTRMKRSDVLASKKVRVTVTVTGIPAVTETGGLVVGARLALAEEKK
jgi:hypothetical protein